MSKEQEIKILFGKYIHNNLSSTEIARLKALMDTTDEKQLDSDLEQLWLEYSDTSMNHSKAFAEVQKNLKLLLNPTVKKVTFIKTCRTVAAVLFPLLVLVASYLYIDREAIRTSIEREYVVSAGKGERASVTLPDGTKVYLNSESTLSYSASFDLDHRNVSLIGEAYFEVTRNIETPFMVSVSEIEVKVLGTTFNIYAYPEEEWIETSLVEGEVVVNFLKIADKQIVLSPNEKVSYNKKTNEVEWLKTDLQIETAWKKGDLIFRSETLLNVLKRIELFYGTKIELEGIYPLHLFTGSFHENEVNTVLENLQQHYKFTYKKTGGNIVITFK